MFQPVLFNVYQQGGKYMMRLLLDGLLLILHLPIKRLFIVMLTLITVLRLFT